MSGQLQRFSDPVNAQQLNRFIDVLDEMLRAAVSNDRQLASHVLDPGSGSHTGTLTAGYGGTGQASYVAGDLLYASGAAALSKLVVGAPGQALIVSAGNLPVWGAAGVTDHGALTGLTPDDDHTQYALLAGRAGGQSLIGGTAASQNLTLVATSHVTQGKVMIHGNSGFVTGNTIGFFSLAVPVAKTWVLDPAAMVTTEVAGAAYGANEQTMLTNLKTDVTNLISKLTELVNALQTYSLV